MCVMGNHQTVVVYDAKRHWSGMWDQGWGGSSNPGFDGEWKVVEREMGLDKEEEGEGVEDCGEGGDDENDGEDSDGGGDNGRDGDGDENEGEDEDGGDEEEDEEEEDDEDDYWIIMDGRSAADVLRDWVRWYETLFRVPGGADDTPMEWDEEIVKPVYRKHSWPDYFDGDAFKVDLVRAKAASRSRKKWRSRLPIIVDARLCLEVLGSAWLTLRVLWW